MKKEVKNKTKIIIKFRQVEANDWDFILDLRNRFYNSFEQQDSPLSRDEHVRYMEKQTKNPNFEQWIIQDDENQNEIGYIRVLDSDVSILIKTEFQGMGYGKEILLQLDQQLKSSKKLVARIISHNISSIKAFEKAGYKLKTLVYEKDIT